MSRDQCEQKVAQIYQKVVVLKWEQQFLLEK